MKYIFQEGTLHCNFYHGGYNDGDGGGDYDDDDRGDDDLLPPPRLVGNGSIRMKKPIQATLPPRRYFSAH